jgi:small multidrug resistance pump
VSAASRRWLRAAAVYNLLWGGGVALLAHAVAWKCVGMMVLCYAPGYWLASRRLLPELVAVGLLGKVLGPVGFGWALATHRLPVAFALVVAANDVVWWPSFVRYLREAANAVAASSRSTAPTETNSAAANGPPSSQPNSAQTKTAIAISPNRSVLDHVS